MTVAKWLRFGFVGILSTATYFIVTTVAGNPPILLDPTLANFLGFSTSVGVSYIGHHSYTFQVDGAHRHYGPRFLVTTSILFMLSAVIMAFLRYYLNVDHTMATAVIAVFYPPASYLLNALWTFSSATQSK